MAKLIKVIFLVLVLFFTYEFYNIFFNPEDYLKEGSEHYYRQPTTFAFITIDTLRRDHVGAYGYPFNNTPFIDKLASEGLVFNNAYTVSSHTAPSHTSMFTGLYPSNHGVLRNHDTLRADKKIAHISMIYKGELHKHVAGFPATNFLEGKVGFEDTREKYKDVVKKFGKIGWFLTAKQNIERVKAWLTSEVNKKDDAFFWLHLYDAHQWQKIGKLDKKYVEFANTLKSDPKYFDYLVNKQHIPVSFFASKDDMLTKISLYDAKIKMINDELQEFFDFLVKERGAKNLKIVLLSDHGEGLGNHNYDSHGKYLYEEQLRIPLIFWNSSLKASKRYDSLISTIDILPTIVYSHFKRSGNKGSTNHVDDFLKVFARSVDGKPFNFNNETKEFKPYVISERRPKDDTQLRKSWIEGKVNCIVDKNAKYIYNENGEDEFYDLQKDPFELNNLVKANDSKAILYKKKLTYETSKFKENEIKKQDLTPKEVKELKALGYL